MFNVFAQVWLFTLAKLLFLSTDARKPAGGQTGVYSPM